MFNNYFNDYTELTSIPKGKLPLKFTMPDIKFYGTENLHYHMMNFLTTMPLKGIDRDMFHIMFP